MANYTTIDLTLAEALSQIDDGTLQLPDFQRPFVWRETDRKQLIESMQKGYPVGGLLLLDIQLGDGANSPFGAKTFEFVPELPKKNDRLENLRKLVLDGQQRLTSTYMAFSRTAETKKWFFINLRKLHEDLRAGRPVDIEPYLILKPRPSQPEALLYNQHLLPLPFISEGRQALRQRLHQYSTNLKANPEEADFELFISLDLEAYLAELFDYKFPCVVLPATLDVEAVANVFTKLNTGGISLGAFDLCVSSLFPKGVRLREMWNGVKDETHIQTLDKDGTALLQAVALQAGKDVKKSALVKNIDKTAVDAYWDKSVTGFKEAFGFLTSGGFTSRKTLPYDTLAPALVAALIAAPKATTPQTRNAYQMKVEKWILQTAFTQRYTEGSDAKKQEDYPMAIKWFVSNLEPAFLEQVVWHENVHHMPAAGARYKALLAILNKKTPLDFVQNSIKLGLDNSSAQAQAQLHHIFPKAWLKAQGRTQKEVDRALNITFLTAESNNHISDNPPSIYLASLLSQWKVTFPDQSDEQRETKLRNLLSDHLIDGEAYQALLADDYEAFLVARGNALRDHLQVSGVPVAVLQSGVDEDETDDITTDEDPAD